MVEIWWRYGRNVLKWLKCVETCRDMSKMRRRFLTFSSVNEPVSTVLSQS